MRARKTDANQREIVKALEAIGCDVEVIGRPVDILVGYRGRNYLIECKNPETRYGRGRVGTPLQDEFVTGWRGQVAKVRSVDEAIAVVVEKADRGRL